MGACSCGVSLLTYTTHSAPVAWTGENQQPDKYENHQIPRHGSCGTILRRLMPTTKSPGPRPFARTYLLRQIIASPKTRPAITAGRVFLCPEKSRRLHFHCSSTRNASPAPWASCSRASGEEGRNSRRVISLCPPTHGALQFWRSVKFTSAVRSWRPGWS